jgi:hypothetical protein
MFALVIGICLCFHEVNGFREGHKIMKFLPSVTLCVTLIAMAASPVVLSDYPIEVIELQSRPLDEILPVIRPLIGANETATGMGNNLVIKASPQRVREIRKLLVELDRPPRRLLISVGNQGDLTRSSSGYRASADIRAGDARVGVNSPGHPAAHSSDKSRLRVDVHDRNVQRAEASRYKVQALEGRPAYIRSGSRVPLRTTERYYGYGVPYQRSTTQLQDVTSGFYVVPRLNGNAVTLEIVQHNNKPGQRRGVINTQSTGTAVRGRLGEWLELGGIDTSSNSHQGGLGRSVNSGGSNTMGIQVKVECLDCEGGGQRLRDFDWPR